MIQPLETITAQSNARPAEFFKNELKDGTTEIGYNENIEEVESEEGTSNQYTIHRRTDKYNTYNKLLNGFKTLFSGDAVSERCVEFLGGKK